MRRSVIVAIMLIIACAAFAQEPPEADTATLIPDWWERQATATIPPARPAAPVIDGVIGYEEWFYASRIDGFIDSDTGNLSELPVAMYLCYDEENLYIAVRIERPPMNPTPRSTFAAGRQEHIWWQDDAFELVLRPGREENGIEHYFAFAGNSVGAWSIMGGALEGSGGDTSIPADWQYAADISGRTAWAAELAIPFDQVGDHEPPVPGSVWLIDLMSQQVTPRKQMVDLGLVWNLGMHGYRSPVMPRFVFVGEDGPILRPHGVGRLSNPDKPQTTGMRMVFYNLSDRPIPLEGHVQIFRASADRPAAARASTRRGIACDAYERAARTSTPPRRSRPSARRPICSGSLTSASRWSRSARRPSRCPPSPRMPRRARRTSRWSSRWRTVSTSSPGASRSRRQERSSHRRSFPTGCCRG